MYRRILPLVLIATLVLALASVAAYSRSGDSESSPPSPTTTTTAVPAAQTLAPVDVQLVRAARTDNAVAAAKKKVDVERFFRNAEYQRLAAIVEREAEAERQRLAAEEAERQRQAEAAAAEAAAEAERQRQATTTTQAPTTTEAPASSPPAPAPPAHDGGRFVGGIEVCNGADLPPCHVVERESGFNPVAENPTSTASGLYQFVDGTFAVCNTGYGHASHAPVSVQVACARQVWANGTGASHWSLTL